MGSRLRLRGWDKFLRFLDPRRAKKALQRELRRKILEQLHYLRRDVISYIDSEKHGIPNSPLTVLIKGSSRPLVDRGDLRQSVSVGVEGRGRTVRGACGVLRTARGTGGKALVNVAAALHEGFVIRVTPKVRAAVFAELRKRTGKKVRMRGPGGRFAGSKVTGGARFAGGTGAKVWRVRGRPFIGEPFEAAKARIALALGDGVKLTLNKL